MQTLFAMDNYPKSYASTKDGDYRLKDYLDLDEADLEKLNDALFELCIEHGDATAPITEYKGLTYIDSGWEWSVFQKDSNTVLKIPAGIFAEVNDPHYLTNTEETYKKILACYPAEFVAKTSFRREDSLNMMEQEFILGESEFKVDLSSHDHELLRNFRIFLEGTLKLAQDYDWLADYWLTETPEGIFVRNVVLEEKSKLFKVIDFGQYLDPSRMYPQRKDAVITRQIKHIQKLLAHLDA